MYIVISYFIEYIYMYKVYVVSIIYNMLMVAEESEAERAMQGESEYLDAWHKIYSSRLCFKHLNGFK